MSDLNSPMYRYWGKANSVGDSGDYHLLVYHCLDVAAVASVWWDLCPSIQKRFAGRVGLSCERVKAWVLFFITIHDLGKFDVRFQLKARELVKKLREDLDVDSLDSGLSRHYWHGEFAFSWVYEDLASRFGWKASADDPFGGFSEGEHIWEKWMPWLQAVAGHHGKEPSEDCLSPDDGLFVDGSVSGFDSRARVEFIEVLESLFLIPEGLSLGDLPPKVDVQFLAGFCSVCDWLGSSEENREGTKRFGYQSLPTELAQYFQERLSIAKQLLEESGLLKKTVTEGGMENVFPEFAQPQQVQNLVDDLRLHQGLTLIEAPTGAGKTEAALAFASRLLAGGDADSIVFALPTQATADAMLGRLSDVAERLFATTDVVLAHGKARFNPAFIDLQKASRKNTPQNHKAELEAGVQCSQWLSQSKKRAFLGQIGVCTIDQVLVSVLPVKHRFVRAFGLGKSVLIVDEVHAYDAYMYGLLDRVLRQQRSMGGSVVLLSATLPLKLRSALLNSWGQSGDVFSVDDAYPMVSQATAEGVAKFTLPDHEIERLKALPERRVEIATTATAGMLPDESLQKEIIEAAESGANVVIICNLVADAQNLASRLRNLAACPVDVFHSRYRFKDRQDKQAVVMRDYGKGEGRKRGAILVATQVVEQSLDIDFDWMITQLCPMDLLFQRLGRLHRHQRTRPQGFEKPRCVVLVPENQDYELHKLIYGNGDAPNSRVLWRTEQLLKSNPSMLFPEVYRPLIEKVYQEDAWEGEPTGITEEYEKFWQAEYASSLQAKMMTNVHQVWDDDDSNVSLMTRDGEMGVNLLPLVEGECGDRFLDDKRSLDDYQEWELAEAVMMNTVPVPRSWAKHLPDERDGLARINMADYSEYWEYLSETAIFKYDPDTGMQREVLD